MAIITLSNLFQINITLNCSLARVSTYIYFLFLVPRLDQASKEGLNVGFKSFTTNLKMKMVVNKHNRVVMYCFISLILLANFEIGDGYHPDSKGKLEIICHSIHNQINCKDVVNSLTSKGHYYSIYTDKNIKDQQNRLQHRSREAHLQYQFDQIEQLRQKNREKFRERIQRKNNG